jgi:hypothetical protein
MSNETVHKVAGFCPMGCGETLQLLPEGEITCSNDVCPSPAAVTVILEDPETEHVVELMDASSSPPHGGYQMKHPLRERVGDLLLDCTLHEHVQEYGRRLEPGRYRLAESDEHNDYAWTPLS